MVKYWEEQCDIIIKLTKERIKFCEKHGQGLGTIKYKGMLKEMERKKQVRKDTI